MFELSGRNADAVRGWMSDLREKKCFRVDADTFAAVRAEFAADSVDNETCLSTIKEVFDANGYLFDPHTAVAYKVAEQLRGENPVLIASTAHWAKFGDNVYRALHGMAPGEPLPEEAAALSGCQLNELIANETGQHNVPANLATLDAAHVRFEEVIDNSTEDIERAATAFLGKGND